MAENEIKKPKKLELTKEEVTILSNLFEVYKARKHKNVDTGFKEGDKVKLNVDKILSHPIVKRIKYKNFVKNNRDTVFTLENVKGGNNTVFTFAECDDKKLIKWHFNIDDLIKID
nr:MAG TPA: hypothetical protein [Caudoviricetes sp.]